MFDSSFLFDSRDRNFFFLNREDFELFSEVPRLMELISTELDESELVSTDTGETELFFVNLDLLFLSFLVSLGLEWVLFDSKVFDLFLLSSEESLFFFDGVATVSLSLTCL